MEVTAEVARTALVRPVTARDAFVVGALHIQAEREYGTTPGPGFLDAFADAWLADRTRHGWLVVAPEGNPLGVVHGSAIPKLPSPARRARGWFHVSLLFVTPSARGHGLGHRLMRAVIDWSTEQTFDRVHLVTEPAARSLYADLGFSAVDDASLELLLHQPRHGRGG